MYGSQQTHRQDDPLNAFAGKSSAVEKIKAAARSYAESDSPLLISGETGTGKELIAHAVHALSGRSSASFIPINCAAFSEHLVESELFGHVAGSFTGATRSKQGLLRVADGGTLFLDEVGDLPLAVQPKMLRVLQFGTFYPVGAEKQQRVNVRVISAVNSRISVTAEEDELPSGLRADMIYRLNVLNIHIPPLRERPEDILPILQHVTARRGISPLVFEASAEEVLLRHPFPGNVRELENLLERLHHHPFVRRNRHAPIPVSVLAPLLHGGVPVDQGCPDPETVHDVAGTNAGLNGYSSLAEYLAQVELSVIRAVLQEHNANLTHTAQALGLSRQGLRNKIARYQIDRPVSSS